MALYSNGRDRPPREAFFIPDPRHSRIAEEEARELRRALVSWLAEGGARDELREAVGGFLAADLRPALRDSLRSPEVTEALRKELLPGLLDPFEDEIRGWVQTEARAALREALAEPSFRAELQEQLRDAVADGARAVGAPVPPTRSRAASSGARSAPGKLSEKTLWWGAGVVLALLLLVALWAAFGRGDDGATAGPGGPDSMAATTDAGSGADRDRSRSAASSGTSSSATGDPLRASWDRWVAAAPAQGTLAERLRSESDDLFACWYPLESRPALARAAQTGGDARFDPCVEGYAVGEGASLPVYAGQLAARDALRKIRAENRCAGREPGNRADLDRFGVDGVRGPGTYAVLNELATCVGAGAGFRVGADSSVGDYLTVLYLALESLGPV